jgi:metal-responsive CopG/Arc/MetJ family transcriptional regulator
VKTAISIPDSIYKTAEKLAAHLGMTRSALYTKAINQFLLEYRNDRITEELNTVYKKETSGLDPVLETMQLVSTEEDDW